MKKRFFIPMLLSLAAALPASAQTDSTLIGSLSSDTLQKEVRDSVPSKRIRINGFRVQVYYGGNDQKSKQQARQMAERTKIWFEDLSVYTSFSSPHWICRVGDFQTREEAMEVLTAMRESGRFPRAIIVKSKINIYEHELRREEPTDSCAAGDSTAYRTCFGIAGRGPAQGGLAKDSVACGSCHD
jgi:hypothetical protein